MPIFLQAGVQAINIAGATVQDDESPLLYGFIGGFLKQTASMPGSGYDWPAADQVPNAIPASNIVDYQRMP